MKKRVVQSEIIKKYSAKNRKRQMGNLHKYSKEWRLYAYRIGKQQYFRQFKLIQQNYMCPICDKILVGKNILHHIEYNHVCQRFLDNQVFPKQPECNLCHAETPLYFHLCSENTVIVHNHCHGKLHNDNKCKL